MHPTEHFEQTYIISLITNLHDVIHKEGIESKTTQELFRSLVWDYFHNHGRTFAWRETTDPYRIAVSEIMLQQTQTSRVTEKYAAWCQAFPAIQDLAHAPFSEVLFYWQGLGYNRRALYLHTMAKKIVSNYNGTFPQTPEILETFSGIGPNTARSICAFAFNQPVTFIETNIRTVFIHCFFPDEQKVSDAQLLPLITQTVDQLNPRQWYYALMDLGVLLKKLYPNPSRKSAHHATQSKFEGSDRQIRGEILRFLLTHNSSTFAQIYDHIGKDQKRVRKIIETLLHDFLVIKKNGQLSLPE